MFSAAISKHKENSKKSRHLSKKVEREINAEKAELPLLKAHSLTIYIKCIDEDFN